MQQIELLELGTAGIACSQALLIKFRAATLWWPMRSQLPEGKIASEHGQPRGAERIRQRYKEGRVAVRSCPMGQDETVANRIGRMVQKSSNRQPMLRSV